MTTSQLERYGCHRKDKPCQRRILSPPKGVTFSLVVLGGAFASHAAPVLLVGSFSACLFWILEGYWKSFQLAYYARAEEIESYFARGVDDIVPMQITKSWYVAFRGEDKRHLLRLKSGDMRRWLEAENKDKIRLLRSKSEDRVRFPILLWTQVLLPHAFVFLGGLLLFMLYVVGVIRV
jgi:hypothetical protein